MYDPGACLQMDEDVLPIHYLEVTSCATSKLNTRVLVFQRIMLSRINITN